MKKKVIIVMVVVILILLVLLVPRTRYLNDGGTVEYKAVLYNVTKLNKLNYYSASGYDRGTIVEILGKEVYNDVVITDPTIINNDENNQKYSKIVDNVYIGLNIPSEWKYEELQKNPDNEFYKFALKLYKNSEEKYAVLYFYNNSFGVCGTGRSSEKITLNNSQEATIGYYDKNTNWNDISFYNYNKYIAVMNNGLINDEAKEVIEFIKTINIVEDYNEIEVIEDKTKDEEQHEFIGTIIEAHDNYIIVEPEENASERKLSDKISMGITRPTNGTNDFYIKGNKIKIIYNGIIMESYPAQIVATKIELAN